ncbi:MAG: AarF/UbiB family protein [Phycisphaerales bacterium]
MASHTGIAGTIRSVRRARQILAVLVRFGFREAIEELGLATLLGGRRPRIAGSTDPETGRLTEAQRVRRVLEELGPTFAKVGQILSTRPDLIPEEWADELSRLQAGITPVDWETIEAQLRRSYGADYDTIFASVEREAIAAASMAQVHRAVLADGTAVVLKILRPGIRDVVAADMEILSTIAALAEPRLQAAGYSATAIVEQFSREISRETDMLLEGRSTRRMARDFADDDRVVFPRVHWAASNEDVLALDEVTGTLLTDLDAAALDPADRSEMVAIATDVVFRQCLVVGFFHADPHPGNIFRLDDGRLAFIDCGMTGYADPKTTELLADLVLGATGGELDRVLRAALKLAEADPSLVDDRRFRADAWRFIDTFRGGSLSELRMGQLLGDFFVLLRRYRLRCPADMVHLIKAITTIEGVAEAIDPDFDVIARVRPYVEQLVKRRMGARALRRRGRDAMLAWTELAEVAPREIHGLLESARRRTLGLQLEHAGLGTLERTLAAAAMTIGFSVVIAALVIGGAVLLLADALQEGSPVLTVLGVGLFLAAAVLAVIRLVGSRFRRS